MEKGISLYRDAQGICDEIKKINSAITQVEFCPGYTGDGDPVVAFIFRLWGNRYGGSVRANDTPKEQIESVRELLCRVKNTKKND